MAGSITEARVHKAAGCRPVLGEAELEWASPACRHAGGVTFAARTPLAEPRSAGNHETWATLVAKFPFEDNTVVSAAAAAAVLVSATEEKNDARLWFLEDEYASQEFLGITSSRSALSGLGKDDEGCVHLQSIIHIDIGRAEYDRGMTNI